MNVGGCQTKYMIISQTHDYGGRRYGAPKCVSLDRLDPMAERVINNSGSSRAECREGLGFVSYWRHCPCSSRHLLIYRSCS